MAAGRGGRGGLGGWGGMVIASSDLRLVLGSLFSLLQRLKVANFGGGKAGGEFVSISLPYLRKKGGKATHGTRKK